MKTLAFKLGLTSVLMGTVPTLAFAQNNTAVDYADATECAALFTFVSMLMPEDNPGREEILGTAEGWSAYALSVAPDKRLIHASSVRGSATTLVERAQAAEYDQQVLEEMLAPVDGKCRVVPAPQAEPVQQEASALSTQESERYQLWSRCAGQLMFVQINAKVYGEEAALGAMNMRPEVEAYIRQQWPQKESEISNDIDNGFKLAKDRALVVADPANPGYAEAVQFIETCDKIGGFALLQN